MTRGCRRTRRRRAPDVGPTPSPTALSLARAGTSTALQRRQAGAAWHQQTRRCLPAHAPHPWCPLGDPGGSAQGGEHQRLAGRAAWQPPPQRGSGGAGQQERSNGLGTVGTRTRVPTRLRRATARRVEAQSTRQHAVGDRTTDCSGDHAVMARQVRPWLAKPRMAAAPRVRKSSWDPTSKPHQGQRLCRSEVRMYGCNRTSEPITN